MVPKKLQTYLAKLGVAAEAVAHKTVYTAYDLAATTGVKLEAIAKTVLVKVEPPYGETQSRHVIVTLPASHRLDLTALKRVLRVKKVMIPDERVMAKLFRMKAGALTPFGELHKRTPVILDRAILKARKVLARSGSFTDSVFLKPKDFLRATKGSLASFTKKVTGK